MNIYDLISRAQKLRKETQLDSVSPDRVGGLHEDTLKYINEFQLLASSPSLHKAYASVSAMQSDKSPKSDLTGKPLKPGQLVVIVPANQTDTTAGDVYRYDGPSGNTSAWTFVAKIGAVPADAELSATSTNPPQNKVVTEKLTELESEVGVYKFTSTNGTTETRMQLNLNGGRVYKFELANDWNADELAGEWKWSLANTNDPYNALFGKKLDENAKKEFLFAPEEGNSYILFFRANVNQTAMCKVFDVTDTIQLTSNHLYESLLHHHFAANQLRFYMENCPFECFSMKVKSAVYKYRILLGDSSNYPPQKFKYIGEWLQDGEEITIKNGYVGNVFILSVMRMDDADFVPTSNIIEEIGQGVDILAVNGDVASINNDIELIKSDIPSIHNDINELNEFVYRFHAKAETTATYNLRGILPNHVYRVRVDEDWNTDGLEGEWKWTVAEIGGEVTSVIRGRKLGQSSISSVVFKAAPDKKYTCFFRASIGQKAYLSIEDITDEIDLTTIKLFDSLTAYPFNEKQLRLYFNNAPFKGVKLINKSSIYKYRILIGDTEDYASNVFLYNGEFLNEGNSDVVYSEKYLGKVFILSVMRLDEGNVTLSSDVLDEIKNGCDVSNYTGVEHIEDAAIDNENRKYLFFSEENLVRFSDTRLRAYTNEKGFVALRIKNKNPLYEYSLLIGNTESYPPTDFTNTMGFLKEGEQAILYVPKDEINNIIVLNIKKRDDAYIPMDYSVLDGVEIEKVYELPTARDVFSFAKKGTTNYQGEKIQLEPNVFSWERYMDIVHYVVPYYNQGGTTFGKYFIQMHTYGNPIAIYDLEKRELVQEIELNINSHCNSISFGISYFDSSDPFPLLYVSDSEGSSINVIRIKLQGGVYSAEVVQVISTRILQNYGIFVANLAIDAISGKMIVLGRQRKDWRVKEDNNILMCVVDIPSLDATEIGCPIGDIFSYAYIYALQGQYASFGKLYLVYGNAATDNGLIVFDYNNGNVLSKVDLGLCGGEPEGIGIYDNALYISWQENFISKHTF